MIKSRQQNADLGGMKTLHLLAMVTLSCSLAACTDSPVMPAASHGSLVHANLPQGATDGSSAVAVAVEAKVDGSGVTTGRISAASNVAQTLTADAASGIGKAAITIPAGTVGVDLDVGLTAGVPVATAEMAAELGLDQPAAIAAAGPSVLVSVSAPLAGTVTLSLPLDQSLALAEDASKLERLIVLYRIVKDGKTIAGFLPKSAFVLENGVALVPIGVGGLYQLGYSAVVQVVAKTAETKAPVQSKVEAKKADAPTDKPVTAVAVVWETIDIAADMPQRKVKVAAVHTGVVRACRIETETYTASGMTSDQREVDGAQALITLTAPVTLKLRARFRCFDEAGKETISPWSADVTMSEVCFQVAARDGDGDGVYAPWSGPLCGFAALPAEYSQTPVQGTPDCDDSDAAKAALVSLFPDTDSDGYGVAPGVPVCAGMAVPVGFASLPGDCDPANPSAWQLLPGYADADGDGFGVGMQNDYCSGATLPPLVAPVDGDHFPNDSLLHGFGAALGHVGGTANDTLSSVQQDASGNLYYLVVYASPSVDADPTAGVATISNDGLVSSYVTKVAADGTYQWTRKLGDLTNTKVGVTQMRIAPDGKIVLAGYFVGTVDFDGAATAVAPRTSNASGWWDAEESFVAKLDTDGTVLWVRNADCAGDDVPYGLVVDASGNIYAGGYFFSAPIDLNPGNPGGEHTSNAGQDAFLWKLDASGNHVTSASFGGTGHDAVVALALNDGKLWATGRFEYTTNFGLGGPAQNYSSVGGQDVFLLRATTSLTYNGVFNIGNTGDDRPHQIAADPRGGVVLFGHFSSATIDLDPYAGAHVQTRAGGTDLWIAAYDETMALRWGGSLSSTGSIGSAGLAVAADGSVYVAGGSNGVVDLDPGPLTASNGMIGSNDFYLLRLTGGGTLDWYHTHGAAGQNVSIVNLSLTPGGSLLVAAALSGSSPVDADFLNDAYPVPQLGLQDGFAFRLD